MKYLVFAFYKNHVKYYLRKRHVDSFPCEKHTSSVNYIKTSTCRLLEKYFI